MNSDEERPEASPRVEVEAPTSADVDTDGAAEKAKGALNENVSDDGGKCVYSLEFKAEFMVDVIG